MQNVIKIYHVVQELCTFSLTANGRTDRRMDSHSDYSGDPMAVQSSYLEPCKIAKIVTYIGHKTKSS